MRGEAIQNIDEAKDRRRQAWHKYDIELKYPRAADEGGDEREDVTEDEEDDSSDNRGF